MKRENSDGLGSGRFLAVALILVVSWIASYFVISEVFGRPKSAGEVGDAFGAVNALFSGLALAFVILTLALQRTELRLQREELRLNREELRGQKEQLEAQVRQAVRRGDEESFFGLVTLRSRTAQELRIVIGTSTIIGVEGFQRLVIEFNGRCLRAVKRHGGQALDPKKAWSGLIEGSRSGLELYFKQIGLLLEFIERVDGERVEFYRQVLRAQLSTHELGAMYLHAASGEMGNELRGRIASHRLFGEWGPIALFDEEVIRELPLKPGDILSSR